MNRTSWFAACVLAICLSVGALKIVAAEGPSVKAPPPPPFPYELLEREVRAASRFCGPARTEMFKRGLMSFDRAHADERPAVADLPASDDLTVPPAANMQPVSVHAVTIPMQLLYCLRMQNLVRGHTDWLPLRLLHSRSRKDPTRRNADLEVGNRVIVWEIVARRTGRRNELRAAATRGEPNRLEALSQNRDWLPWFQVPVPLWDR